MQVEINKRYDLLRSRLTSELHRAKSPQEAVGLRRAIDEAHLEYGKELRDSGKLKWSGVVIWGPEGFVGEDRKECELWYFLDKE